MDAISDYIDNTNGDPLQRFSNYFHTALGVRAFGFQDNGTRNPTNYDRGGTVNDDRDAGFLAMLLYEIRAYSLAQYGVQPPPSEWPRHEFDVDNPICSTTSTTVVIVSNGPGEFPGLESIEPHECTLDNVMCWATRRPAPRSNGSEAIVVDGEGSVLTGGNPIRTWIDPNERMLVNETQNGGVVDGAPRPHVLHDPQASQACADGQISIEDLNDSNNGRCSYVRREVDMDNDQIVIRTHGEGHNPSFRMVQLNEIAGRFVFNSADRWITERLAKFGDCDTYED